MNEGEMRVLNALMRNEGLTFSELKQEVKLSAPVLSQYLKRFELDGFIDKTARKYSLRKTFISWEKLSDREQAMRFLASSAPILAIKIHRIKDEAKRLMMVKEFIKLYVMQSAPLMVSSVIGHCLDTWLDKSEKLDTLLPLLNNEAKNWIVPYVQKVALGSALNIKEIIKNKKAIDSILDPLISEAQKTAELIQTETL